MTVALENISRSIDGVPAIRDELRNLRDEPTRVHNATGRSDGKSRAAIDGIPDHRQNRHFEHLSYPALRIARWASR